MFIPPNRTASRINRCSLSSIYLKQTLLSIFILHTATGSPKKSNITDMIVGSTIIASAKALVRSLSFEVCSRSSSDVALS